MDHQAPGPRWTMAAFKLGNMFQAFLSSPRGGAIGGGGAMVGRYGGGSNGTGLGNGTDKNKTIGYREG